MNVLKRFLNSEFYKGFILPTTLLAATIIGAGVFSLPYVASQAGWGLALFYLLLSPIIFYFLHTMYADILIRSGQEFKFVSYAKHYLGELAYWISILVTVLGSTLTLTAYIVLANSFLTTIFPIEGFIDYYIYLFWVIGSWLIFRDAKRMAKIEFLITVLMVGLIAILFYFGTFGNGPIVKMEGMTFAAWPLFFLPFGPFLFSFSGRTAIPSLVDYYKENKMPWSNIKKVIFWGTFLPAIIYLIFIVGVIGISETITSDSVASIALLPFWLAAIMALVGFLTLMSSYMVIGDSIKDILEIDMEIPRIVGNAMVVFIPLLFVFGGFNDFFRVISLAGGIFLALESIIVIALWRKIEFAGLPRALFEQSLPQMLVRFMLIVFFLGVLYAAMF